MFIDNELKNYGMKLQSMGMEIQNFGIQMKNNIMQNIGNQIQFQNIGNQIQNMGAQISNIAIQIFNMGIQVSNIIVNQNNVNMMNQYDLMNNYMHNGINEKIMNDNNEKSIVYNAIFKTQSGLKNNITINSNRTVENLLNIYLNKMGLNLDDIQKKNIFFIYNSKKMELTDKTKLPVIFGNGTPTQMIIVHNF